MRLVVLGDSHVTALSQGHEELGGQAPPGFDGGVAFLKLFDGPDNAAPFFQAHDDRIEFPDERVTGILRQALGQTFLSAADRDTVFAFCMGVMTTLLVRLADWKVHAPAGAASYTHKRSGLRGLVSEGVVRAIVLDHHKHVLAFAAAAKALGLRHMIVSSPPLRQDERTIAERGRSSIVVAEVDRIARAAMLEEFARLGTPVVLPPPEAYQDEGRSPFLRPELHRVHGRDSHHANAAFGALMMPRIIEEATWLAHAG